MKEEEKLEYEVEALDPDISNMMSSLGLSMSDADVSAVVTGESYIENDMPDPGESDGDAPLRYAELPKKKKVVIGGKVYWDITDIIGNSEEIMAMNTVVKPKEKPMTKKPKFADGIMRRPDRL